MCPRIDSNKEKRLNLSVREEDKHFLLSSTLQDSDEIIDDRGSTVPGML